MTLEDLPHEDWAALASLPVGARTIENPSERLIEAGIVDCVDRTRLTQYGQGVAAAARVLVPRGARQAADRPAPASAPAALVVRCLTKGCPGLADCLACPPDDEPRIDVGLVVYSTAKEGKT